MEKENKQSVNLKNLEQRINEFSTPLALFVKEESLQKLFLALNGLFEVVQDCNKNHKLPLDDLYAKLKPVDDVLITFAKLYEQLVTNDVQIGLIGLIKAFTQKSEAEILISIVRGTSKISPAVSKQGSKAENSPKASPKTDKKK
jgi:hypothetical protein